MDHRSVYISLAKFDSARFCLAGVCTITNYVCICDNDNPSGTQFVGAK